MDVVLEVDASTRRVFSLSEFSAEFARDCPCKEGHSRRSILSILSDPRPDLQLTRKQRQQMAWSPLIRWPPIVPLPEVSTSCRGLRRPLLPPESSRFPSSTRQKYLSWRADINGRAPQFSQICDRQADAKGSYRLRAQTSSVMVTGLPVLLSHKNLSRTFQDFFSVDDRGDVP